MVKAVNVDTAISEIGKVKELKLKLDSLIPHPEKIPLCEVTNCKPVKANLITIRQYTFPCSPQNLIKF